MGRIRNNSARNLCVEDIVLALNMTEAMKEEK